MLQLRAHLSRMACLGSEAPAAVAPGSCDHGTRGSQPRRLGETAGPWLASGFAGLRAAIGVPQDWVDWRAQAAVALRSEIADGSGASTVSPLQGFSVSMITCSTGVHSTALPYIGIPSADYDERGGNKPGDVPGSASKRPARPAPPCNVPPASPLRSA